MNAQDKQAAPPPLIKAEIGQRELVLRVLPLPADCNFSGDVSGAWLMGQADIAGGIMAYCAANGKKVTTVAVNSLVFKHPVFAGNLLTFYAKIIKIGHTSITIEVTAYAWNHDNFDTSAIQVIEATMIYIAVDNAGKPVAVLDGALAV